MRASLSDFDSLVRREQVCALCAQSPNCCPYSVIFRDHSLPRGARLTIESICATAAVQVLEMVRETLRKFARKIFFLKKKEPLPVENEYCCIINKDSRL